ncbi:hypothetical protein [Calycomorphotria hydatis]|uniref:hypothetical protein n=1 Tax=Calycomorphotria hydatis TaxID=2528027 RepID=UPI00119DDBEC|nr:hypothetical protein [Calycomorphotria hydatis]
MPRWAQVAFAARCARRVQPLYRLTDDHPDLFMHVRAVDAAITFSESAATMAQAVYVADYATDADFAANVASGNTAYNAASAADAASYSVYSVQYLGTDASFRSVRHAAAACEDIPAEEEVIRRFRLDYNLLIVLSEADKWTDQTPVPKTVFSELWPPGEEPRWSQDGKAWQKQFLEEPVESAVERARREGFASGLAEGQEGRVLNAFWKSLQGNRGFLISTFLLFVFLSIVIYSITEISARQDFEATLTAEIEAVREDRLNNSSESEGVENKQDDTRIVMLQNLRLRSRKLRDLVTGGAVTNDDFLANIREQYEANLRSYLTGTAQLVPQRPPSEQRMHSLFTSPLEYDYRVWIVWGLLGLALGGFLFVFINQFQYKNFIEQIVLALMSGFCFVAIIIGLVFIFTTTSVGPTLESLSSNTLLAIAVISSGALGSIGSAIRNRFVEEQQIRSRIRKGEIDAVEASPLIQFERENAFNPGALLVGVLIGLTVFLLIKSGKQVFLMNVDTQLIAFNPYSSAFTALIGGIFSADAYLILNAAVVTFRENMLRVFQGSKEKDNKGS